MDPMRIKGEIIPIDSLDWHILKFQETKAMGRAQEWMRKAFNLERWVLVQVNEIQVCPKCKWPGTEIVVLREQGIERYQMPKPPQRLVLADFLLLRRVTKKGGSRIAVQGT